MRRFADFIVQDNKRFLLLLVRLKKTKRKPAKKNTVLGFSIKLETTCKSSAHLEEKKRRPKFDIEWLRPDVGESERQFH